MKQTGDNLSLSCTVQGMKIQWKVNEIETLETRVSGQFGENNSTLIRTNINSTDAGLYQCFDSNGVSLKNFSVTVVSSTFITLIFSKLA